MMKIPTKYHTQAQIRVSENIKNDTTFLHQRERFQIFYLCFYNYSQTPHKRNERKNLSLNMCRLTRDRAT